MIAIKCFIVNLSIRIVEWDNPVVYYKLLLLILAILFYLGYFGLICLLGGGGPARSPGDVGVAAPPGVR